MRLRTRFTLGGAAAVGVLVVAIVPWLIDDVDRGYREDVDQLLQRVADVATPSLVVAGSELPAGDAVSPAGDIAVVLTPPSGSPQRIGAVPAGLPPPTDAGFETVELDSTTWRVLTVTVDARLRPDDAAPVAIQYVTSFDDVESLIAEDQEGVVRGALLLALLAAGASWLVGGYATRPLRRLRTATERLQPGDRVPSDQGVAEVDALAATMNDLLDRVDEQRRRTDEALDASRTFAANAAHELRTPLTSISADLDVLATYPDLPADERATVVAEAQRHLTRVLALLGALSDLARGDVRAAGMREPVDLAELADEVIESARQRSPAATIELRAPSELIVEGWSHGLRVLLANLVDNALVHGRPPVTVTIGQSGGADRSLVEIVVDDAGSGIPIGQRERVLERFARGSSLAPGTGLGLALVAQQAQLHGGTVTVADSPTGGARLVVTLRVKPAPAWKPPVLPTA